MQKNLDERQLNRSRCIAAPLFQKVKNIYIYSKKKEIKKREKSVLRQVLPVEPGGNRTERVFNPKIGCLFICLMVFVIPQVVP